MKQICFKECPKVGKHQASMVSTTKLEALETLTLKGVISL